VLEGGYDLAVLANSVETVLMGLKRTHARNTGTPTENPSPAIGGEVSRVKQTLKPYWGEF